MRTVTGTVVDRHAYVNLFKIEPAGSWHCVYAETERWSAGLWLPETLARTLLDSCQEATKRV